MTWPPRTRKTGGAGASQAFLESVDGFQRLQGSHLVGVHLAQLLQRLVLGDHEQVELLAGVVLPALVVPGEVVADFVLSLFMPLQDLASRWITARGRPASLATSMP